MAAAAKKKAPESGRPQRKTGTARSTSKQTGRNKSGKTAAPRRTTGKKTGRAAVTSVRRESRTVGREILLVFVLAFSVLIFLANLHLIGRYGTVMSDALFGVFGLMAWLFPFFLFFGFAFFLANRGNPLIARKMTGLVILFLFLAAFVHLLTVPVSRDTLIGDLYRVSYEDHTGGGFAGGIIIWAFAYCLGTAGAYVLTICGLIVGAIVLTQKPLLTQLGAGSRNAAIDARNRRRMHREEKALELEEEREQWLLRQEEKKEKRELREAARRRERMEMRQKKKRRDAEAASRRKKAAMDEFSRTDSIREEAYGLLDRATLVKKDPVKSAETEVKKKKPRPIPEYMIGEQPAKSDPLSAAEPMPPLPAPAAITPEVNLENFEVPSFLRDLPASGQNDSIPAEEPSPLGDAAFLQETEADRAQEAASVRSVSEEAPATASSASKGQGASGTEGRKEARRSGQKASPGSAPVSEITSEILASGKEESAYRFPPVSLLTKGRAVRGDSGKTLMETARKLQKTLEDFGVNVIVVNVSRGPTVTRYELQPDHGVKVSRIINLQDDIKLNLATSEIRIEAPIPGKAAIGIEVPNKEVAPVMLRDICESPEFTDSRAVLAFAVGKDIGGNPVVTDIEKMPHLLIAGATGSGKSVCINTLIMSILLKSSPDQVKFLMIDPKVVELKIYDGIPHLLIPVVTDARKAAGALNWAVQEMTERYNRFAAFPGVRDIRSYNERVEKINRETDTDEKLKPLPRIVVIVDELADLMMVASSEVEDAICRLAQLARAAGIHLIIATQRPSVNVVTGLIKANMPSRVALAVTSGTDSRTILDMNGAEKLLGHGDMLFYPQGYPKPARVQGCYVSDHDISEVVRFLTDQSGNTEYSAEVEQQIASAGIAPSAGDRNGSDDRDEYFAESGRLIIEKEKASIGMLQRAFKIGFNRAARIMDQLAEAGVVGGEEGTKPRKILMNMEEFETYLSEI